MLPVLKLLSSMAVCPSLATTSTLRLYNCRLRGGRLVNTACPAVPTKCSNCSKECHYLSRNQFSKLKWQSAHSSKGGRRKLSLWHIINTNSSLVLERWAGMWLFLQEGWLHRVQTLGSHPQVECYLWISLKTLNDEQMSIIYIITR